MIERAKIRLIIWGLIAAACIAYYITRNIESNPIVKSANYARYVYTTKNTNKIKNIPIGTLQSAFIINSSNYKNGHNLNFAKITIDKKVAKYFQVATISFFDKTDGIGGHRIDFYSTTFHEDKEGNLTTEISIAKNDFFQKMKLVLWLFPNHKYEKYMYRDSGLDEMSDQKQSEILWELSGWSENNIDQVIQDINYEGITVEILE